MLYYLNHVAVSFSFLSPGELCNLRLGSTSCGFTQGCRDVLKAVARYLASIHQVKIILLESLMYHFRAMLAIHRVVSLAGLVGSRKSPDDGCGGGEHRCRI